MRCLTTPQPAQPKCRKCGAKTRAGTPCERRNIHRIGRCKLHGGHEHQASTIQAKRRPQAQTP
ncbi:HGGxSTG domain-containing protein [Novosphingobium album (ex Hu et al. 2023)]|uniref:HGGxSTG domain-containing protein n=1 Tax=Novosphingobium album (ex Hu et al. 2023) TaxID=2930093 RepID=UPI003AF2431B